MNRTVFLSDLTSHSYGSRTPSAPLRNGIVCLMAQPPLLSEEGNTLARCFFLVRWKQFYAALFSFLDRFTGFLGSSVTGFCGASAGIDSFLTSSFLRFWSCRCLSPYDSLYLISSALSGKSNP